MTGPEFRAIRQQLGLTLMEWGRALGYQGDNPQVTVSRLEAEGQPITRQVARLAEMYRRHGVPDEFLTG